MTLTTTKLSRRLPAWKVTKELKEEAAVVREITGVWYHYTARYTDRFKELLRKEDAGDYRSALQSYLDHDQLAALLAGRSFPLGEVLLRSCVYASGWTVHLQRHLDSPGALPQNHRRWYDGSGFAQYPECRQNGEFLESFNDEHYTRLASEKKFDRFAIPRAQVLSPDEVLDHVCLKCVDLAHSRALDGF